MVSPAASTAATSEEGARSISPRTTAIRCVLGIARTSATIINTRKGFTIESVVSSNWPNPSSSTMKVSGKVAAGGLPSMYFRRTFALGAVLAMLAAPLAAQWPATEKLDLDAIYRLKEEG